MTNMKIILISGKATAGKDASANILKNILEANNKKVLITHYADLLKYIAKTFFNWNGEKDEYGRQLLQWLGTDIIRNKRPDYWVDFISDFLKLFPSEWDYVIIPDVRFPNEIERMKNDSWDVFTLRVERLNYESSLTEEQKSHVSETALDGYKFDYIIHAKTGLDVLEDCLYRMYEEVLCSEEKVIS